MLGAMVPLYLRCEVDTIVRAENHGSLRAYLVRLLEDDVERFKKKKAAAQASSGSSTKRRP